MMGVQTAEARLFYDFCLDDHVPSDHLLRSIDGHLDLDGLRRALQPMLAITTASAISLRLTFTSGGPRPSSSSAKGSNARPSQIVVCTITCMPHNLNNTGSRASLPGASNLSQFIS